jgi:RNA polymerase sigma factor (sigma-70 family)
MSFRQHMRNLRNLLRRRGQTREDADDLVQEAFLRLHTFLAEGKEVRHPAAFLARTALNLAVDAHRRDVREHRDQFVSESIESLPILDLAPTPEEIFSAENRLQQMKDTLDRKVSPRTREVFFLHRLEGFTHEEIAERMNMSVRTVEKHIARAITVVWIERKRE